MAYNVQESNNQGRSKRGHKPLKKFKKLSKNLIPNKLKQSNFLKSEVFSPIKECLTSKNTL